ncbi:hypothetical protein BLNAU_13662 [Blattamonas nauphoetae]|uniref:MMS19 nucleotide excision repair protein n=1 Tax=Blattamonas nauphoetae TaxID=2049346 RepID=A0ABQ9XFZ2_9EUKA|nr:hypothetical protein BLNAU_13662 [Blattamonas nauphoetae]
MDRLFHPSMDNVVGTAKTSGDAAQDGAIAFLNWNPSKRLKFSQQSRVFVSLVSLLAENHPLDAVLEDKAVELLNQIEADEEEKALRLISKLTPSPSGAENEFARCLGILVGCPNDRIASAGMGFVKSFFDWSSPSINLKLIEADLIGRLVDALSPHTLPIERHETTHKNVMQIVTECLWVCTGFNMNELGISDDEGRAHVRETVLTRVITPCASYVEYLSDCRLTIVEGSQSYAFSDLLTCLLDVCVYHCGTLEFVLSLPIAAVLPISLSHFESEPTMDKIVFGLHIAVKGWREDREVIAGREKRVLGDLREEGMEDSIEEKLHCDPKIDTGVQVSSSAVFLCRGLGLNVGNF